MKIMITTLQVYYEYSNEVHLRAKSLAQSIYKNNCYHHHDLVPIFRVIGKSKIWLPEEVESSSEFTEAGVG